VDELMSQPAPQGDYRARVGRYSVTLTTLERVYWPDEGYTKADLLRYYHQAQATILPYLKDRPIIMRRYPAGIRGHDFYQHDIDQAPPFVKTLTSATETGRDVDYILANNAATLLYMANLGVIGPHPWHSRAGRLDYPDWIVFDLDPEGNDYDQVCELALVVRQALDQLGLQGYAKTSGATGMHVYVPIEDRYPYDQVAPLAESIARRVVNQAGSLATLERSVKKRGKGQIYLDHLQNARGKSVVAPYAVRPRPGATVSAPLTWDEVAQKPKPQDFTILTMPPRLAAVGDLFRPVLTRRQSLDSALELVKRRA
jgi:bifunctional non-homologous end joining protein LigD